MAPRYNCVAVCTLVIAMQCVGATEPIPPGDRLWVTPIHDIVESWFGTWGPPATRPGLDDELAYKRWEKESWIRSQSRSDLVERYGHISEWDTSQVDSLHYLFVNVCRYGEEGKVDNTGMLVARFNEDLSKWSTGNVMSLEGTFKGCAKFNSPLPWNTSSVRSLSGTFEGCTSFNQPLQWDTSSVRILTNTFAGATSFNQPLRWDTPNLEKADKLLRGAVSFNSPLVMNFRQVTDLTQALAGCPAFNQPLDSFNLVGRGLEHLESMDALFEGCKSLDQRVSITAPKARSAQRVFAGCTRLNSQVEMELPAVETLASMFEDCATLNAPVTIAASRARTLERMFYGCVSLNAKVAMFAPNATTVEIMFDGCGA